MIFVVYFFANPILAQLKFFNESCEPESLEQADKCVETCREEHVHCMIGLGLFVEYFMFRRLKYPRLNYEAKSRVLIGRPQ